MEIKQKSVSNKTSRSSLISTSSSSSSEKKEEHRHLKFAFVSKCVHDNNKRYYCCPSYCSPGGIRSLLFNHQSEGENSSHSNKEENQAETPFPATHNNIHWPSPLHFHLSDHLPISSKYLSHLIGDQHLKQDWDSLGNSNCYIDSIVFKSLTASTSKHRHRHDHHKHKSQRGNIEKKLKHQSNSTASSVLSASSHSKSTHSKKDLHFHKHQHIHCGESISQAVLQSAIDTIFRAIDSTLEKKNMSSHPHPPLTSLLSFLAFDNSLDSDDSAQLHKHSVQVDGNSHHHDKNDAILEPATIIYHESARSIVFRDHLRRVHDAQVNKKATTPQKLKSMHSIHEHEEKLKAKPKAPISESSTSGDASADSSTPKSTNRKSTNRKSTTFRDDISYISNSTNGSGGKFSNIGETAHAVHSCSINSLGSSLDATHDDVHTEDEHDHSTSTFEINLHDSPSVGEKPQVIIANFTPEIDPLPPLDFEPHHEFQKLLLSNPYTWNKDQGQGPEEATINQDVWSTMTESEKQVVERLKNQMCAVKTIKNSDLTSFIKKFPVKNGERAKRWLHPKDFKSATKAERINKYRESDSQFHSFYTSLSLLPPLGIKMRCYGSTREYSLGVIFPLPTKSMLGESEDDAAKRTDSWAWPAGYAAKTEFNITPYGDLINGREEALVSLSTLRSNNHAYVYEKDYEILGKLIKGGFNTLPYNEIYCRIGGSGRMKSENDISFDQGVGLPIALFVRTCTFGDLAALLRFRARLGATLGKSSVRAIPLLYIDPNDGVRVLTEPLQKKLLSTMSNSLNPFQNPHLRHKTQINEVSETHFQQKLEELLDLDDDNIRNILTAEECGRLAGGFGATDDSVAHLLMDALEDDGEQAHSNQNKLQRIVNEGLTSAVRAGDFNTSRQLLILYTLVASRHSKQCNEVDKSKTSLDTDDASVQHSVCSNSSKHKNQRLTRQISSMSAHKDTGTRLLQRKSSLETSKSSIPAPPPPPPLDTDRLRSATNSDGLLAVLGAAEVLKSLQTGAAAKRAQEAADSIDEWVEKSEHSVAYRLASWRDLTAAQGDLKIATENNSNFMAFVSNKAITNRRRFATQLRNSIANTNFEGIEFLKQIHSILGTMHSPCLRLELLQFILGLDNRYSVAHVARSIELAATCLDISATDDIFVEQTEEFV